MWKTWKDDREMWIGFGDKKFDCPGEVTQKMVGYLRNNKILPSPCDKCYKGLIFWSYCYTEDNVNKFRKMVSSFNFKIRGKYNKSLVVFYFREKQELLDFLDVLKEKMQEFGVNGKIQWRKACKEYQDELPEYWKNAKELKF